jgi:hypothetical protein
MVEKEGTVDILDIWLQSRLKDVHTVLPGTIEVYYGHSQRKARVKVGVQTRTKKDTRLTIPPIDNVPVMFPSSQGFKFLFPLKKGDGCLILFSEEGIGAWLKGRTEVAADSLAKFSLTDAICVPGLWSFKNVPNEEKGSIIVDDQGNININQGTKGVARKDDAIVSNAATDTTYEAWRLIFNTWATGLGLGTPMPASRTGKIIGGSTSVKAGG